MGEQGGGVPRSPSWHLLEANYLREVTEAEVVAGAGTLGSGGVLLAFASACFCSFIFLSISRFLFSRISSCFDISRILSCTGYLFDMLYELGKAVKTKTKCYVTEVRKDMRRE